MLIGVAGVCGISPREARKCSVRDLELIEIAAIELFGSRGQE